MRDILFRGKAIDVRCNERWIGKGEWVYGFYHYTNWYNRLTKELVETDYWILPIDSQDGCQVDPSTVGQYIGLTDKNGKRIFEGDIVSFNGIMLKISFKNAEFCVEHIDGEAWTYPYLGSNAKYMEVIGNVHDNPELLEAK